MTELPPSLRTHVSWAFVYKMHIANLSRGKLIHDKRKLINIFFLLLSISRVGFNYSDDTVRRCGYVR